MTASRGRRLAVVLTPSPLQANTLASAIPTPICPSLWRPRPCSTGSENEEGSASALDFNGGSPRPDTRLLVALFRSRRRYGMHGSPGKRPSSTTASMKKASTSLMRSPTIPASSITARWFLIWVSWAILSRTMSSPSPTSTCHTTSYRPSLANPTQSPDAGSSSGPRGTYSVTMEFGRSALSPSPHSTRPPRRCPPGVSGVHPTKAYSV